MNWFQRMYLKTNQTMNKTQKSREELESIFRRWKTFKGMPNAKTAIRMLFEKALSQRDAEVREEIVKELKGMSVDVVAPDRKPPYRTDYVELTRAIELTKPKPRKD